MGVVGAAGRMGREVLKALTPAEGFQILLAVDREAVGRNARDLVGNGGPDVLLEGKLGAALDRTQVDALVDFSHHTAAASHASSAMKRGVAPVIGCTGLGESDLSDIRSLAQETGVAAMYIPNFAIGAVLMMHFSRIAARWMPDAEIIEMHHDRKDDAPSGTAMLTAEMIQSGRKRSVSWQGPGITKVEGVRGGRFCDVNIHSVRLPGLLAHQTVHFGGPGEVLTLRHDSLERSSFMEGVKLALRTVRSTKGLTIGLDSILLSKEFADLASVAPHRSSG